jgi:lipooligosaccharide transport system permease protein
MTVRKSAASFAIPSISYRVWKVWRRNFDVFMKTAGVNFLPSILEPILYLVAFGFGLGSLVENIGGIPYISYIAPALVAIAIMQGSFFECTYSSFVRCDHSYAHKR